MPNFDPGAGIRTIGQAASSLGSNAISAMGALGSVAGTVSRVAGALNNLSNPAALVSALRSANLPTGGNAIGQIFSAGAQFVGSDASSDWRVRLSMPSTPIYTGSPILQPLVKAGGLVWPFTPSVNISSSTSYDDQPITHQNYSFLSYQNSKTDAITINGAFHVEDAIQAQYWIAAIHYLRSITKMFSGDMGKEAGNPPPIVLLNGYGDYVFKNIPVIVTQFSCELPSDVNYIATNVGAEGSMGGFGMASGGGMSSIESISATTGALAGLAGAVGAGKAARALGAVSAASGVVNGVKNLLSAAGGGGGGLGGAASNGATHVPVKSTISVTVRPIYSREDVRKFNLGDFVNGKYVNNIPGYN